MEAFCGAKWHNKTPMGLPRSAIQICLLQNVSDINKTRARGSHHYPGQKHEFSHGTTTRSGISEYEKAPGRPKTQLADCTRASYLNFAFILCRISSVFAAILSRRMRPARLSYKRDSVTVATPDFCQSAWKRTHKFVSARNPIKNDLFVKSTRHADRTLPYYQIVVPGPDRKLIPVTF